MQKTFTWYMIILILLASCTAAPGTDQRALLKGDWASAPDTGTYKNNPLIFSFTDSACINGNPFNGFSKYQLNDTLLTILPGSTNEPATRQSKYSIIKLNRDSLLLQPGVNEASAQHLIRLGRIKEVNALVPERVFFSTSGCYGSCPSIFLEIDSSRNILFYGAAFTVLKGGYKGKLNPVLYCELCSKIRQLPLDSLKDFYEAPWTDDQLCQVSIKANGKLITSSAYGFNEEPPALRILLNYLMDLYRYADISKDSAVNRFYFECQPQFSSVNKFMQPPPVRVK